MREIFMDKAENFIRSIRLEITTSSKLVFPNPHYKAQPEKSLLILLNLTTLSFYETVETPREYPKNLPNKITRDFLSHPVFLEIPFL